MSNKTTRFDIDDELKKFKKSKEDIDYNDWFTFFQKLPAQAITKNSTYLLTVLPSDGYAALRRWEDIFDNPDKMEKVVKSKMQEARETNLLDLATSDDDEAFYEGMIREAATQLNGGGASPQEVARLTANINIFRKELRDIRSRKPKDGTTLAKVLAAANIASNKAKPAKKTKATPVKTAKTASKAAGATKSKKTSVTSSKQGKKSGEKEPKPKSRKSNAKN